MTANQLAYNKLLEDQRSHIANEEISRSQAAEQARHNYEMERYNNANLLELTRHNQEQERISVYDADLRYQASIYATETNALTSRYVADTNAAATRYAASMSASATRYAADQSASAARDVAQTNKAARTFETNVNASIAMSQMRNDLLIARESNATKKQTTDATNKSGLGKQLIQTAGTLLLGGIGYAAAEAVPAPPRRVGF